jgi:hypothetical protein
MNMNRMAHLALVVTLLIIPGTLSSQWRDPSESNYLRQGTRVRVRFPDNLDSGRYRNGDQFEAILDQDLVSNGRVLAHAGSVVFFRLGDVMAGGGGSSRDRSRVSLTLTAIQVGFSVIPIETNTITIGTAPNMNQRLNFRTARNTAFNQRAHLPESRGYEPDRALPFRELPRPDYQMNGGRGFDLGTADHGSFHWRGRVDGSDYIELRNDRVTVRHVQAQPITKAAYDARSHLPQRPVIVQLNKLQGRGRVVLYQQPSASNNFMASVYIEDSEARSDFYEFELIW